MVKSTEPRDQIPAWLPCPIWCRVDHVAEAKRYDPNYRSHEALIESIALYDGAAGGRCQTEAPVTVKVWRGEDRDDPLRPMRTLIELVAPSDTSGSVDTALWTSGEARAVAHALIRAADVVAGAA